MFPRMLRSTPRLQRGALPILGHRTYLRSIDRARSASGKIIPKPASSAGACEVPNKARSILVENHGIDLRFHYLPPQQSSGTNRSVNPLRIICGVTAASAFQ